LAVYKYSANCPANDCGAHHPERCPIKVGYNLKIHEAQRQKHSGQKYLRSLETIQPPHSTKIWQIMSDDTDVRQWAIAADPSVIASKGRNGVGSGAAAFNFL
jgi:hypothetical protein